MSSIKRAWYSVIRKPIKSILLFLTVLAISLFLMAGMSGRNANIKIQDKTRQAVGASLLLVENEANMHTRMDEVLERNNIPDDFEGTIEGITYEKLPTGYILCTVDNSFDTLLIPDIRKIASLPQISDYNVITVTTRANQINFERIEDPDADQSMDLGCVHLLGERNMALETYVKKDYIKLIQGRLIKPQDKNVCVISENLADKNKLNIGDKLQMNNYKDKENSKIYEANIIGIYQIQQKITPRMSGDTYRAENMIFTDLRFPEKVEGENGNPLFEKAVFTVGNVDKYESVKEDVKKLNINWSRYDLIDDNGNLETMSENFHSLKQVSTILLVISATASLIILILIFIFWIKNRKREIGIMMSLGISKKNIVGQILIEGILIGITAFLFSIALSPKISNLSANYFVSQQEEVAEEQKEADSKNIYIEGGKALEQSVSEVTVNITGQMILADGILVITLIGASVLISGIFIMVKKPKEILSEMS